MPSRIAPDVGGLAAEGTARRSCLTISLDFVLVLF
jgi:hypothetical protein